MRKQKCAGIALMSLFFLVMSIGPASAIDEYVYGTTYFTITITEGRILNLDSFDQGFNWLKWNWTLGGDVVITECILYDGATEIGNFNTTLTSYNWSFLEEDYEYNLSCRGYDAGGSSGPWTEIIESTESVFYRIISGIEIWKTIERTDIPYRKLLPILYVEFMEGL